MHSEKPTHSEAGQRSPAKLADRIVTGALVALIVGLGAIGVMRYSGGGYTAASAEADRVTQEQARDRARQFNASGPLELRLVTPSEMKQAIATMKLPDADRRALEDALAQQPIAAASPSPGTAARQPARLAWITLWDTDAEDRDSVRIDSAGFSATVQLSNTPTTLAIPVPAQGVVNITGLHDGGGGITIGALSGGQRVLLPIMSVGQVLGVPVAAR